MEFHNSLRGTLCTALFSISAFLSLSASRAFGQYNDITTQSVTSGGILGNNSSIAPTISGDGRYVLFSSIASNLSGGKDSNPAADIFLHDGQTGATSRVSVNGGGAFGDEESLNPKISTGL